MNYFQFAVLLFLLLLSLMRHSGQRIGAQRNPVLVQQVLRDLGIVLLMAALGMLGTLLCILF